MENQNVRTGTTIDVNNILFWVLLLYLVYMIQRGIQKSKEQLYSENAGSDVSTQQAISIRQAINPSGFGWLIGIDGTNKTDLLAIASGITNYSEVAKAYKALYGSDLTSDVTSDVDRETLAQFWAAVNAKPTTSTTGGTTTTSTTSLVGRKVYANQTVNIRAYSKPTVVSRQAKKGELLGTYVGEKDLTVTGQKLRFVHFQVEEVWGLYKTDWYALKNAVNIV